MDPKKTLRDAEAALASGSHTVDQINELLAGAGFHSLEALRARVNPPQFSMGPVTDFIGSMSGAALQGATFGHMDEIMGRFGGEDTRQRFLGRQQGFRDRHPVVSGGSELGGAMAAPLGVGGKMVSAAARTGATRAGRVIRGAGAGLGLGAAGAASSAALQEVGESEGPVFGRFFDPEVQERALQAGTEALPFGALLGAAAGGAGGHIASRARGRSERVGQEFADRTQSGGRIGQRRSRIRTAKDHVSDVVFGGLERRHPAVTDPQITGLLEDIRDIPGGQARLRRLGIMERGSQDISTPSFADLRRVRTWLRQQATGANSDSALFQGAFDEITDAMTDAFGEPFVRANRMWRQLSRHEEDLADGFRMATKPADEIEEFIAGKLSSRTGRGTRGVNPQRLNAFNQGRVARIRSKLEAGDENAVGFMREMADRSVEMERRFADLFPSNESWQQFRRILKSEASDGRVLQVFKMLSRGSFGLGVGVGAGRSIFQPTTGGNTGTGAPR